MKPTEQNPKKSTATTGFFATLCGPSRVEDQSASAARDLIRRWSSSHSPSDGPVGTLSAGSPEGRRGGDSLPMRRIVAPRRSLSPWGTVTRMLPAKAKNPSRPSSLESRPLSACTCTEISSWLAYTAARRFSTTTSGVASSSGSIGLVDMPTTIRSDCDETLDRSAAHRPNLRLYGLSRREVGAKTNTAPSREAGNAPTTAPDRNLSNTNTNAGKPRAQCKTTQPSGVAIKKQTQSLPLTPITPPTPPNHLPQGKPAPLPSFLTRGKHHRLSHQPPPSSHPGGWALITPVYAGALQ